MLRQGRRVTPQARGIILFLLIATSLFGCARPAAALGVLARPFVPSPGVPSLETTEFLAAYSRGDEALADSLASPLYRTEWERVGLSAEQRTQIVAPGHKKGEPFAERLRFTFVGGAIDALGFGHLLFVARPALPGRPLTPSVFRLDVDPAGRVVWLEMVWHFGDDVDSVRAVIDPAELGRVPQPPTSCCARLLFGISSTDGREGYYAFAHGDDSAPADRRAGTHPPGVGFFAVDSEGQIRPGAWTYNLRGLGPVEYGRARPSMRGAGVEPELAPLLEAYLASLD